MVIAYLLFIIRPSDLYAVVTMLYEPVSWLGKYHKVLL